jgi:hypothetical protein
MGHNRHLLDFVDHDTSTVEASRCPETFWGEALPMPEAPKSKAQMVALKNLNRRRWGAAEIPTLR